MGVLVPGVGGSAKFGHKGQGAELMNAQGGGDGVVGEVQVGDCDA